ncbi:TetR/AcrR family transcriptional regulator (plasmid) [Pseudonocardia bannensis]|uniref:TetR/AcrR family transcriptional regulator n=1 Tax=Pseudonocardia bannensis TaxID=630973 RepID=A0A848DHZ2_9PSEU|nr:MULTISPECIES: TetR/AcrR family transcriptional regulator [Pseudonocardia]NMH92104.1 TetR/AcrR family transcriptional regulator [Pseudonocardia bannensis]
MARRAPEPHGTSPTGDQEGSARGPVDDDGWDRRRREILEAAAQVFFLRGFERGTTKEIAALVGLTQSAIYHYVGSKHDLLVEIARQVDRDFSASTAAAFRASDDPVEQLRSVIYAFTAALARNRYSYAVYWKEYRTFPPEVARAVAADQRTFVEQTTQLVERAQAAGALPADQPTEIITNGLLGMLAWMYWWYQPDGPHTPDSIARGFIALIGLPYGPPPAALDAQLRSAPLHDPRSADDPNL